MLSEPSRDITSWGWPRRLWKARPRYLAAELGPNDIPVNSISGGPLKTLSAMAVGGFSSILANIEEHGPLRRNVTGQDVGETARYLLSDMGRGVTGSDHPCRLWDQRGGGARLIRRLGRSNRGVPPRTLMLQILIAKQSRSDGHGQLLEGLFLKHTQ